MLTRKLWVLERESECVCLCNTPMSLYEWVDAVDGRQLQQCDSRAELHRYQRWHFGLHYPPTAPRETDGNSSSSGRITPPSLPPLQPQPLPELVNLKALLPDALSALAWLWLDPLCHTAVSTPHEPPSPDPAMHCWFLSSPQPSHHTHQVCLFIQSHL